MYINSKADSIVWTREAFIYFIGILVHNININNVDRIFRSSYLIKRFLMILLKYYQEFSL